MTKTEFIGKWTKTDFFTYNETDVRENFIAPLLKLLGYGKRIDVYDINYNEGWGKSFFSIDQAGCEEKFEELIQIS